LCGAEPAIGADVETLEGNISVGAVSERRVHKFGQVHATLEAIRCLQQTPTIHQYRYSLHVSCSSEIVWIAIAGADVNPFCSATRAVCLIANPAFIVCDACLKVAHFVSVYAVFARKKNDRKRSWT
jgi:hypothetical protein